MNKEDDVTARRDGVKCLPCINPTLKDGCSYEGGAFHFNCTVSGRQSIDN
jgi:hypothetical protein